MPASTCAVGQPRLRGGERACQRGVGVPVDDHELRPRLEQHRLEPARMRAVWAVLVPATGVELVVRCRHARARRRTRARARRRGAGRCARSAPRARSRSRRDTAAAFTNWGRLPTIVTKGTRGPAPGLGWSRDGPQAPRRRVRAQRRAPSATWPGTSPIRCRAVRDSARLAPELFLDARAERLRGLRACARPPPARPRPRPRSAGPRAWWRRGRPRAPRPDRQRAGALLHVHRRHHPLAGDGGEDVLVERRRAAGSPPGPPRRWKRWAPRARARAGSRAAPRRSRAPAPAGSRACCRRRRATSRRRARAWAR